MEIIKTAAVKSGYVASVISCVAYINNGSNYTLLLYCALCVGGYIAFLITNAFQKEVKANNMHGIASLLTSNFGTACIGIFECVEIITFVVSFIKGVRVMFVRKKRL